MEPAEPHWSPPWVGWCQASVWAGKAAPSPHRTLSHKPSSARLRHKGHQDIFLELLHQQPRKTPLMVPERAGPGPSVCSQPDTPPVPCEGRGAAVPKPAPLRDPASPDAAPSAPSRRGHCRAVQTRSRWHLASAQRVSHRVLSPRFLLVFLATPSNEGHACQDASRSPQQHMPSLQGWHRARAWALRVCPLCFWCCCLYSFCFFFPAR